MAKFKCPECGSRSIIKTLRKHFCICEKCGLMFKERVLSQKNTEKIQNPLIN